MRFGLAIAECVEPDTDILLRALDARPTMPHLLLIWVRWDREQERFRLDPRLLRELQARDVEPVLSIETTGLRYEDILAGRYDCQLRVLGAKADGCVARVDQEPMSKGLAPDWYRHPRYVPTFGRVSGLLRDEGDVRVAYCTTAVVEAMAEFYPGDDACQVVGFDLFSRKEDDPLPPVACRPRVRELDRIAPGKPRWVFETGRLIGRRGRAPWLGSWQEVEGIEAVMFFDMKVPQGRTSPDDFTWTPAVHARFGRMAAP